MKEAFLVLGAESSGTRLVTKILINCGCNGIDTHEQFFDTEKLSGNKIVWRRSIPHFNQIPDLDFLYNKCKKNGYNIKVIVTIRDWYSMIKSQENNHCKQGEGLLRTQQAYIHIFKFIEKYQLEYIMLILGAMILQKEKYLNKMLNVFDLKLNKNIIIKNVNKKYYEK